MYSTDTIAAIITAISDAGVGIIRISGPDALKIADSIFRTPLGNRKLLSVCSHTIHYGYIVEDALVEASSTDWKKSIVDEVLVSVMLKPRSYTTEDTVEINCHGGVFVMRKVLRIVLDRGARLANPGEFTERAFLNGRIDLSAAEAVMDVISSTNELASRSAMSQLNGSLFGVIKSMRDELIYEIAFIESALDDPEHISLDGYPEKLYEKIQSLLKRIQSLIDSAYNGRLIKEGISTVIVGKPNVGKSSLINILSGTDRAIVTDIAGTTRDVLCEHVLLDGIALNVYDTAGIRETGDKVEKIGVEKAKQYLQDAELVIFVVDSSVPLDENDREIVSLFKNKKVIVLLNKSDLKSVVSREDIETLFLSYCYEEEIILSVSALLNEGIHDLSEAVKQLFFEGKVKSDSEIIISNERHKALLDNSYFALKNVCASIDNGMPEDFFSIDLMTAYTDLGKIIGEEVEDDLMQEIFSKFCMGK